MSQHFTFELTSPLNSSCYILCFINGKDTPVILYICQLQIQIIKWFSTLQFWFEVEKWSFTRLVKESIIADDKIC